jgi:hypothetical protein
MLDRLGSGPTHCVVLTQPPNLRYVQLMIGHRHVHVEASSNRYMVGDFRLSPREETLLQTLGFRPPSEAFDGFPENSWLERPFTWGLLVAELVTSALLAVMAFDGRDPVHVDVFGADHPCVGCAWDR